MGRLVAIDYGQKRCGIAVTDTLHIVATGLTTVRSCDLLQFLQEYAEKESVECFVVGYPKQNDGSDSDSMVYIRPFVKKLATLLPQIPVVMYDERFTSVLAHRSLIESGAKKKTRQNKALVDEMSAIIILNSYLDMLKNQSNG